MMVKGHLLRPKERRLSQVVCIKYNNLFHFLKQPSFSVEKDVITVVAHLLLLKSSPWLGSFTLVLDANVGTKYALTQTLQILHKIKQNRFVVTYLQNQLLLVIPSLVLKLNYFRLVLFIKRGSSDGRDQVGRQIQSHSQLLFNSTLFQR